MNRVTLAIASMLLITASAAFADIVPKNALPQSAVPQIEPIVLGMVTGTTAHTVDVTTTTGEKMTFEFDSRTVMPLDLNADTRVKIQFKLTDSGLHLAQRVTRLEPGSFDWQRMDQEMGRNENTSYRDEDNDRDNDGWSDERQYRSVNDDTNGRQASDRDDMANRDADNVNEHHDYIASNASTDDDDVDNVNRGGDDANAANDNDNDRDDMPSTASELPLVLALGVLALAGSGALWLWRRRSV